MKPEKDYRPEDEALAILSGGNEFRQTVKRKLKSNRRFRRPDGVLIRRWKWGANTYWTEDEFGNPELHLYNTTIVRLLPTSIRISKGGYETMTTRNRIRKVLKFYDLDLTSCQSIHLGVKYKGKDAVMLPYYNLMHRLKREGTQRTYLFLLRPGPITAQDRKDQRTQNKKYRETVAKNMLLYEDDMLVPIGFAKKWESA